jgi:hypothetical protein
MTTPPEHDVRDLELLHVARMLKDAGGIPAHGNQRSERDAGCRIDFDNPEQEAPMEIRSRAKTTSSSSGP